MKRALTLIFTIGAYAARLLFRGVKGVLVLIAIVVAYIARLLFRGVKRALALIAVCTAGFFSIRGVKRALALVFIITVCVAGFLSIRGTMPFIPVLGVSMEPVLHAGDVILTKEVSPSDVKVGDIIVFTIPQAVREYYNYPPVVAHRVIEVHQSEVGVTFRTKGDNSGEDPFTVRPQDLRGQVSKQIRYLGFPLLFFQSRQGLIFVVIALSLLTLYLYANEISRGRQKLHRGIFAPVIEENQRSSRTLERRMKTTEKEMAGTQQALTSFASAIAEYAEHLKSHTGAIQGLSEASQELKKGAVEQNKILTRLVETMEEISSKPKIEKIVPKEEIKPEVEVQFPPGCARSHRQLTGDKEIIKAG
jgi:signal peptidase I